MVISWYHEAMPRGVFERKKKEKAGTFLLYRVHDKLYRVEDHELIEVHPIDLSPKAGAPVSFVQANEPEGRKKGSCRACGGIGHRRDSSLCPSNTAAVSNKQKVKTYECDNFHRFTSPKNLMDVVCPECDSIDVHPVK